mgnify:CR=1 FL=1
MNKGYISLLIRDIITSPCFERSVTILLSWKLWGRCITYNDDIKEATRKNIKVWYDIVSRVYTLQLVNTKEQ